MAARNHSDADLFLSDVHLEERRPDSQEGLRCDCDVRVRSPPRLVLGPKSQE